MENENTTTPLSTKDWWKPGSECYLFAAEQMIGQGRSSAETTQMLIERGMSHIDASSLVMRIEEAKEASEKNMQTTVADTVTGQNTNRTYNQTTVDEIYQYAANLMVNENLSEEETKWRLVEKGLDEDSANIVVNNLTKQKKERGRKDMIFGALWCLGGIIVTAITYSSASESGGTYIIAWGAIVFGAIQFFKGLFS